MLDCFAEDHLSRRRLEHARHGDIHVLAEELSRVVDDHHRAIVQIDNTLVVLLAFLENKHAHELTGKHDGFEGIGELVDIEDLNASHLRHFVEVEIVGDDLGIELPGQLDDFQIHFP